MGIQGAQGPRGLCFSGLDDVLGLQSQQRGAEQAVGQSKVRSWSPRSATEKQAANRARAGLSRALPKGRLFGEVILSH